jgi:hypothetical protein
MNDALCGNPSQASCGQTKVDKAELPWMMRVGSERNARVFFSHELEEAQLQDLTIGVPIDLDPYVDARILQCREVTRRLIFGSTQC